MSTVTVHLVAADGTRHSVLGRPGQTLMQAAVDAGIDGIAADCGGLLSCATCHVIFDEATAARVAAVAPLAPDEASMLEMTAVPAGFGSRLACQLPLSAALDGITAALPERQI